MKKYLVLGAIIVGLMVTGVIHFQKNGDEVNISIDKGKLKKVSSKLIDEGKELIDDVREKFEDGRDRPSELSDEAEAEFHTQTRRFTPSRSR